MGDARTESRSASSVCWTMPIVPLIQFSQKEFQMKQRWEWKHPLAFSIQCIIWH